MSRKKSEGGVDLLAFGAHPDDVELAAGGCLADAARRGYKVGIVDATRGERGTSGSPRTREREAAAAAAVLGVRRRENLGLVDGGLECNQESRRAVVERLRALRPSVVLAPYRRSLHPDHRVLANIVRDACFLAGLARWPAAGRPWRPRKLLFATAYQDVRPTLLVDVSRVFEAKLKAIRAYRSQVTGAARLGDVFSPDRPLLETIRAWHAAYGAAVHVQYAEPFHQREPILFDDVMEIPVTLV